MKIQVTQEHINNGVKNQTDCPIANAINSKLHKDYRIGVLPPFLDIYDVSDVDVIGKIVDTIEMPDEVANFIDAFDADKQVLPFDFEVDLRVQFTL